MADLVVRSPQMEHVVAVVSDNPAAAASNATGVSTTAAKTVAASSFWSASKIGIAAGLAAVLVVGLGAGLGTQQAATTVAPSPSGGGGSEDGLTADKEPLTDFFSFEKAQWPQPPYYPDVRVEATDVVMSASSRILYVARQYKRTLGPEIDRYWRSDLLALITDDTSGAVPSRTWRALAQKEDGDRTNFNRLATSVDRNDPGGPNDGRTLVAATSKLSDLAADCVLYVSTDYGNNWSAIHREFKQLGCADVAVDSTGRDIVVLTERGRVLKSTQHGAIGSFVELFNLDTPSFHLATTPDLQRIIATSQGKCAMISDNGGSIWRQLWSGVSGEACRATALDAQGLRVVVGLYSEYTTVDRPLWYSTEQGENLKEQPSTTVGRYLSSHMDDTGNVVVAGNYKESKGVIVGDGAGTWRFIEGGAYRAYNLQCSVLDRCMTLALATWDNGLVLGTKQRACLIRDDPNCALTDESLAKPGDWFSFERVFAAIDAYAAYSTISTSASGSRAYTISARDHQIHALSETSPKSFALPAKRDRSEWRAIATNALVSNPGSSLDGLFYAACTSDGTVYASSSNRMWDEVNDDIKAASDGAVACTHIQLNSDASQVAVLTSRSEVWIANITKGDFSCLNFPAGSFRKVLLLTDETALSLAATPNFESLVVTMSSSCAMVSNDLGATWNRVPGVTGSCIAAAASGDGRKVLAVGRSGSRGGAAYLSSTSSNGDFSYATLTTGMFTSAASDPTGSVFIVAARDDVDDDWRKGKQMLFGDGTTWVKEGPGFAARSVACTQGDNCATMWVATTDGIFKGTRTRQNL